MRISPKYDVAGGLGDFWNEIRRPQPYRLPILLASCAFPAFFLYFFAQERVYAPPETPDIVYITSFAPDRTDAQIVAAVGPGAVGSGAGGEEEAVVLRRVRVVSPSHTQQRASAACSPEQEDTA